MRLPASAFQLRPGLEDLRYAWRSITRAKALTAILLVSLGLGTGANAAVFTAIRALLFDPPPGVAAAGALVLVHTTEFSGARYGDSSYPDFLSIRSAASAVFDTLAVIEDVGEVVVEDVHPARVEAVSSAFFATLRMRAERGRLLDAGVRAAALPPAVISSVLWTALGARDDVVGSRLRVGGREHVVAGIAARGFRGLRAVRPSDVWVPIGDAVRGTPRGDRRLAIAGRLREGAGVNDVERVLAGIGMRLAEEFPETNRGTMDAPDGPRLFQVRRYSRLEPEARSAAILIAGVVMSAVALLLGSACVTAGCLLLARGAARRRELAVKMALGAPRERLVRQLLAESLLVSLAGGAAGLLFAGWAGSAISGRFPPEHASMLNTGLDAGLVLLTVGIACAAGVAFGIAPAFHATGAGAIAALRADSGEITDGRGSGGLRRVLIVSQIAMSTVLVIGAGLLTDSLKGALAGDLGFAARQVAVFTMETPGGRGRPEAGMAFHGDVGRALREIEGVQDAGWASTAPLARAGRAQFRVEAGAGVTDTVEFDVNVVSPEYFGAMGMLLVEGRPFDHGDRTRDMPVAIVDDLLARRHFGPAAAGHHLLDSSGRRRLVVGVVRSGRYRTLQNAPRPTVYLPLAQAYTPRGHLFVRTAGDPGPMLDTLAGALRRLYPDLDLERSATLDAHLADALALDRLTTTVVGVCGLLALIMSTIGAYGVMGDAVRRRTREIGLRVALGAGRPDVVRLVCAEVAALTAIGALAGVAATVLAVRAAQSLVFGLPGPDVVTLTATPALLSLVLAAAAVVPLRRALRVSPTTALRVE